MFYNSNYVKSKENNAGSSTPTEGLTHSRASSESSDGGKKKTRRTPRSKVFKEQLLAAKKSLNNPSTLKVETSASELIEPLPCETDQEAELSITQPGMDFTFTLQRVEKPVCGYIFRKRTTRFKYVNLRSFVPKNKIYVCDSRMDITCKAVSSLSLADNQQQATTSTNMVCSSNNANLNHSTAKKRHVKNEKHQHRRQKRQLEEAKSTFPPMISGDVIESGDLIRGVIRINPNNPREAYVSNKDPSRPDHCITSVADRNTALEGDEVLIKLQSEGEDGRKICSVVSIVKKVHPRTAVGHLKKSIMPGFANFQPRDQRIPTMEIPEIGWPIGFQQDPNAMENTLFVAQLVEWTKPMVARGVIIEKLGISGDIGVETKAILKEFGLDTTPFSQDVLKDIPNAKEIPASEFEYREDIRKECVFTIDPLTARDLDDAISVKSLPNGNYEIGVHISDASYYLPEATPLDEIVCKKATTIYLVDNVYHMLPVDLCLHCSLLPGEDKLAFSVFWEMNTDGEIFNTRFARTVLNSCTKLAYEHAQEMIMDPNKQFQPNELPQILNGFTAKDLSKTLYVLQKIAVNLRESRVANGSLRLDQIKLLFSLNPDNGEPLDIIAYENKEAHRLIEDFMLLANISVAKKIYETYPTLAFLRCHEPPKMRMLAEVKAVLATCGIHVDVSSSRDIHLSLRTYESGLCRGMVLNHLFAKPMTRARYFCAGTVESEDNLHHYALSVPIYTHFTSPIRRYADIMVHRLLAASLGYSETPNWTEDFVQSIAANCNRQKYNAKRAGEASSELYLAHYIDNHQPYIQDCVVIDVKERHFDAIVLKTGTVIRLQRRKCEDNPAWTTTTVATTTSSVNVPKRNILQLIVNFPITKTRPHKDQLIVDMFTVVKVQLKRVKNSYKLEPLLLRPSHPRTIEKSMSANSN